MAKAKVAEKKSKAAEKGPNIKSTGQQVTQQPCVLEVNGKKIAVTQVNLNSGVTLNLGDYESARFDVGVSLAAMDEQSIEEVVDAGWGFVMQELGAMIKDTRENAAKKRAAKDD
jgi:hypothetical protein